LPAVLFAPCFMHFATKKHPSEVFSCSPKTRATNCGNCGAISIPTSGGRINSIRVKFVNGQICGQIEKKQRIYYNKNVGKSQHPNVKKAPLLLKRRFLSQKSVFEKLFSPARSPSRLRKAPRFRKSSRACRSWYARF